MGCVVQAISHAGRINGVFKLNLEVEISIISKSVVGNFNWNEKS